MRLLFDVISKAVLLTAFLFAARYAHGQSTDSYEAMGIRFLIPNGYQNSHQVFKAVRLTPFLNAQELKKRNCIKSTADQLVNIKTKIQQISGGAASKFYLEGLGFVEGDHLTQDDLDKLFLMDEEGAIHITILFDSAQTKCLTPTENQFLDGMKSFAWPSSPQQPKVETAAQ